MDTTNYNMGTVNLNAPTTPTQSTTPAYPTVPTQMNVKDIQSVAGMQGNLQTPPPAPTANNIPQYTEAVNGAVKLQEEQYKAAQEQVKQQEAQMGPLRDLYMQTGLQSDQYNQQYQQGLQQQFQGLNDFKAKTQELQNQLNSYNTETDNALRKMEIGNLASGGTTGSFQDLQSRLYVRERDIRANQIKAAVAGAAGQQALAQDAIQMYIQSKYNPAEEKLKTLERYLTINEKELDRKDTKAYQAQQNYLSMQKTQLENARADDESKQKIMATAAQYGAPNALLQQIGNAKSPVEAIQLATGYMSDPLEKQLKQAQLSKIYLDNEKTRQEIQLAKGQVPTPIGGTQAKSALTQMTAGLKLNEGQGKALAFAQRAIDAETNLKQMVDEGYDPTSATASIGRGYGSENAKKWEAYMEQYVTAVLRKDSGAQISDSEREQAKLQYDPATGSFLGWNPTSMNTVKKGIRNTAIDSIISEAGPAARALQTYKQEVSSLTTQPAKTETYTLNGKNYVKGPDGLYYPQ
jgi:hypothetical protein